MPPPTEPLLSQNLLDYIIEKSKDFTPEDFKKMIDTLINGATALDMEFYKRFPAEAEAWHLETTAALVDDHDSDSFA